jgi:type I restriction enzyme S subunit
MELKPGYKQTEVGVIPEDWDCVSIQSAASNTSNAIVGGPFGSDLTSSDYVYSGVPVVRGANLGSKMIGGSFVFVSTSKASALAANLARPQDLVFTQRGTLGQVSLVPDEPFESYLISQSQMKVSLDGARYGSEYVYHYFSSAPGQKQILDSAIQTGVPHTNLGICRKYVFPAPCITEQEKICDVLNDIDSHLQLIGRLLDKKKQIKQAAMQELLTGKRRLPGFEGEWEVKMLKDIIKIPVTDGPHMTPRFLDTGVPFLSVNNLVNNRIDFGDLRFISKEDHCTFSRKCKPQKGDILLGKAASVGKVAIVDSDTEFNIWSPIALIRITENHSPAYVYYALQGQDLVGQISLLTNASSQGNIGMGDIEKLAFRLPGKEEQTAIASTLSELDAELATLEARMEKVQQLKQGMMQQLLTGKIRLQ